MKKLKLTEKELKSFGFKIGDKLEIQKVDEEIVLSKIDSERIEDLFRNYTGGAFNSPIEYMED